MTTQATDNGSENNIDGTSDLKESYDPKATSTQLDEQHTRLRNKIAENLYGEYYYELPDPSVKRDIVWRAAEAAFDWADTLAKEAETLMGEAVIARHRQANYQWEKTESFIQSYQTQKIDDPHGIMSQLLNRGGEE